MRVPRDAIAQISEDRVVSYSRYISRTLVNMLLDLLLDDQVFLVIPSDESDYFTEFLRQQKMRVPFVAIDVTGLPNNVFIVDRNGATVKYTADDIERAIIDDATLTDDEIDQVYEKIIDKPIQD